MKRLAQGTIAFQKEVFEPNKAFFAPLACEQHPVALMITCCDSRVEPALITQSPPGTLFSVKNIGNIVPVYDAENPCHSEAAAIEYALTVLNIHHIIVCGHTDCGAMKALLKLETLPKTSPIYPWLAPHHHVVAQVEHTEEPTKRLNELIRRNIVQQLQNLTTYPEVSRRLASGDLHLYGWKYRLETGETVLIDTVSCRPEALSSVLDTLTEEPRPEMPFKLHA